MAKTAPVLHFSGRFRFDFPEYNNDPRAALVAFDPNATVEQVLEITAGDPARYFEFTFAGAQVRSVTYRDGSTATAGDAAIGLPVQLSGLLVDIAPSAIVAVLHAGRLAVGAALRSTVDAEPQNGRSPIVARFDQPSVRTGTTPTLTMPNPRRDGESNVAKWRFGCCTSTAQAIVRFLRRHPSPPISCRCSRC